MQESKLSILQLSYYANFAQKINTHFQIKDIIFTDVSTCKSAFFAHGGKIRLKYTSTGITLGYFTLNERPLRLCKSLNSCSVFSLS